MTNPQTDLPLVECPERIELRGEFVLCRVAGFCSSSVCRDCGHWQKLYSIADHCFEELDRTDDRCRFRGKRIGLDRVRGETLEVAECHHPQHAGPPAFGRCSPKTLCPSQQLTKSCHSCPLKETNDER